MGSNEGEYATIEIANRSSCHSTEFCPKDCNESAQMERFLESFGMGTVTIDHSLMQHCASSVCDITLWQLMWGVMLMHD